MRAAQKGSPSERLGPPARIQLEDARLRSKLDDYRNAARADSDEHQLRTRKRRRQLALAIAHLSHQRGKARLPYDRALKNCALPADKLRGLYAELFPNDPTPAESTVQEDLKAMFDGCHVDTLPRRLGEHNGETIILSPGFTYDLRVLGITLGKHGRVLLHWLRKQLSKCCTPTHRSLGSKRIGPISERERAERRARGMLKWAISHARGRRNNVGNVLAWVLRREIGLDRSEVEQVMDEYQQEVEWYASPPYTQHEAMATVRSAFRRGEPGQIHY